MNDATHKPTVATFGSRRVKLLDSIAWLSEDDAWQIVVSGSHGGRSAGDYAMRWPLALCCFNDAGVGKERAGIAALGMLEQRGTPALTYAHTSACIGDAADAWAYGVISHVNAGASALGLAPGRALRDAISRCEWPT